MPEFGERLFWYALTLIGLGVTALVTPQIAGFQRVLGWILTAAGLGMIFYIEWGNVGWLLHASYSVFGVPYPRLSLAVVSLLGAVIFGGIWLMLSISQETPQPSQAEVPAQTKFPTMRMAYSSRQVLQICSVPGNYKETLNLDNVATLLLWGPSREGVTLLWSESPNVRVENPGANQAYKVPGSSGIATQFGPIVGHGVEVQGLTMAGGQVREIPFDLAAHSFHLIRVGERIFRVSLESIRDKADVKRKILMFFEYEFAVSEEEPTAENRAAAITQGDTQPSR